MNQGPFDQDDSYVPAGLLPDFILKRKKKSKASQPPTANQASNQK